MSQRRSSVLSIAAVVLFASVAMARAAGGPPAIAVDPVAGTSWNPPTLSTRGAQSIADAVVAHAVRQHQAVSVAIVDAGGNLLLFKRMDGAPLGTIEAALHKASTALKLQASTAALGADSAIAIGLAAAGFTPLPGAQPIRMGKDVIGAVAVSGGAEDELITAGLAALKP